MAREAQEDPDAKQPTESHEAEPKSDGRSTLAKGRVAVAFAFFATISVAALLVTRQVRTRQDELRQQLSMATARLGRATELKYESQREVVNNVTGVLRLAQSEAGASLVDAAQAQAKVEMNAALASAAKDLWQQSK